MQVNELTIHAKLRAKFEDLGGYITYIFEDLEFSDPDLKYITCIRFPNWDNKTFNIEDKGFLNIRYIKAGEDEWWDGKKFNTYNYTNVQFLKFIPEKVQTDMDLIID